MSYPECERAWLTAIAGNVCRWERRTLGRRRAETVGLDLDRIALARPAPDEAELLVGLRDALAQLSERQRTALVMREWQGLSAAEIARELRLSTTATHALLTRSRRASAGALVAARRSLAAVNAVAFVQQLSRWTRTLFEAGSVKVASTASL